MFFKRISILVGVILAGLVAVPVAASAADGAAQAKVVTGSSTMPAREVARLVGATAWSSSVEGTQAAATVSTTSVARKHCYGKVYWKAGENLTGQTIWKEWNHTAWCGYPYHRLLYRTVHGYTDTYTNVSWNVGDESWNKNRDQYRRKAAWTRGHAHFSQCAGPVCVSSEDVNTHMHIFANGYWKGS